MTNPEQTGSKRRLAAVVLARIDYGEADLIVTFLTRELGLLKALARYGRRSLRRFGGGLLSPGVSAWYNFTLKPQATLAFVENGEENLKSPRLPADPVRQSLAAFALELARSFETPFNPAPESFRLLVHHLGRLARCSSDEAARLMSLDFVAKYMELAGFGSAFSDCLICGAKTAGTATDWHWDPEAGGLYCPLCLKQAPIRPNCRLVSPAILNHLQPQGKDTKLPLLTVNDLAEAELFFEKLAEHQLGRSLKAMKAARQFFDKTSGRP